MDFLVMDHFMEILIWVVNDKVLVGQQSQEGLGACGQCVHESHDVWCMRMRNCLFAEEATEIDIT